MYVDKRRPDRHTLKHVLVAKTFNFVRIVWSQYIQHNLTDLRYVFSNFIDNNQHCRLINEMELMSAECDGDDDDGL